MAQILPPKPVKYRGILGCAICRLRKKACWRFQEGHTGVVACCACSQFNIRCQGWSEPLLTDEAVLDQARGTVRKWIQDRRNRNRASVSPLNLSTFTSQRRSTRVPKIGGRLGKGAFPPCGEKSNFLLPEWQHGPFDPSSLITLGTPSVTPFTNFPVTNYATERPGELFGMPSNTRPELIGTTQLSAMKSSIDPYGGAHSFDWLGPPSHIHAGNKDGFFQFSAGVPTVFAEGNSSTTPILEDGDKTAHHVLSWGH